MSSKVLELTQVVSPGSGKVTKWYVSPGAPVGKAAQLGIFRNGKGIEPLQAPVSGTVARLLVREDTYIEAGTPVAEIAPDEPQQAPQRKPSPVSTKAQNGSQRLQQQAEQPANSRRGLHIEELTIKPQLPAPVPRKQERRPKIVTRTTRPTDRQSQRFDDLTTELQSLGYDFARSELERCMYDFFLSLDVAEVARLANRNREQEQRGRYGIGFV